MNKNKIEAIKDLVIKRKYATQDGAIIDLCSALLDEKQGDDWIPWQGGTCPVSAEARVDVILRSGKMMYKWHAGHLAWEHYNSMKDIVAYNIAEEPEQSKKWIPWQGGRCPLQPGIRADVFLRNGEVQYAWRAELLDWANINAPRDIIAYSIVDK